MDAKIKELLTRLSFFAEDGMADKPIVEIAKQADALLTDLVKQQNTQQPVAAQCRFEGEQEWKPCTIAHHLLVKAHPKEWPHYETRALFTELPAPPVPRDVLMAALGDCRAECAKHYLGDADDSQINIATIADRYASKVQPERSGVTLEEVVSKLKVGENGDAISDAMTQATADMALGRAIREGRAKQPEPVNQQLLVALKAAKIGLRDWEIPENRYRAQEAIESAIAAAEAAQPVVQGGYTQGVEAVAKMLEKKADDFASENGYDDMGSLSFGGNLNGELMRDYHSGLLELAEEVRAMKTDCQQPASAQPVAVPDDLSCDDIERLKKALSWEGYATPESLEECAARSPALVRDLITAVLDRKARGLRPEAVPAMTIKVGMSGKAFDGPQDLRAYTYKHQPDNTPAWKLGKAAARASAGGDSIDHGLSLLKELQGEGFGVFELPAAQKPEGGE